jgi:hypothetical protein
MRTVFTAGSSGLSKDALQWGERTGRWTRVQHGVYADGPEPITAFDRERAQVLARATAARGGLAGVLHRFDAIDLDGRPTRRIDLPDHRPLDIEGTRCADALHTLIDLAATVDDERWEQALETALRKRLVRIDAFDSLPSRQPGATRINRVLARRGDVPPTESLLETLMVQLARTVPGLPDPVRQLVVRHEGLFVARLDLTWPTLGLFAELDGQHHLGQPVYDASRETAVVAATGWLPGRFTWREVTRTPRSTARRLGGLAAQARRRVFV